MANSIEQVTLKGVGPHGNEWEMEVVVGISLSCTLCDTPITRDNVDTFAWRLHSGQPVCGACVEEHR